MYDYGFRQVSGMITSRFIDMFCFSGWPYVGGDVVGLVDVPVTETNK